MAPKRLGRRAALKKSFTRTEAMAQAMMPATGSCSGCRGHGCPCAGGKKKPTLPSSEELMTMNDESLTSLVLNNWTLWMKARKKYIFGPVPESRIPSLFNYPQPVPIIEAETPTKVNRPVTSTGEYFDDPDTVRFNKGDMGSSSGFRCVDYSIPTINYLGSGLRFWIIVKKSSNHKLEKYVSGSKPPRKGCLQTPNDFLIMSPETLIDHKIDVVFEIQREGKSIILFEGAYYAWINLVDNTSCLVSSLATLDWFDYAKRHEKYKCTCRETYRLDLKRMELCYHYILETAKVNAIDEVILSADRDVGLDWMESDSENEDENKFNSVKPDDTKMTCCDEENEESLRGLKDVLATIPYSFSLDEQLAKELLQKVSEIGTSTLIGVDSGSGLVNIACVSSEQIKALSDAIKAINIVPEIIYSLEDDDSDPLTLMENYVLNNSSEDEWEQVDPAEVFPHLRHRDTNSEC